MHSSAVSLKSKNLTLKPFLFSMNNGVFSRPSTFLFLWSAILQLWKAKLCHVRPPVSNEQLCSHWTDFRDIRYWGFFLQKFVKTFQFGLKLDQKKQTLFMRTDVCFCLIFKVAILFMVTAVTNVPRLLQYIYYQRYQLNIVRNLRNRCQYS